MKIACSRKDLADAVAFASAASSVRTSWPVLQTLRLKAGQSSLSVLGCDGELWAERIVAANVAEEGSVCVAANLLGQLLAKLPDGEIRLELDGTSLALHQGSSDWRMMALPAVDFPPVPDVAGDAELKLTMGELKDAVNSVAFAVADDQSRAVLTGVLLTYDGTSLTLVATDTHRLSVRKIAREGLGSNVSAVVPERALKAIRNLPVADDESLQIRFDDTRLMVDCGPAKVVSQLLAGAYPHWERVVPTEHSRTWILDKAELAENLNRAMILARESNNRVRFSGKGDQVLITARADDSGEAKEEVAAVLKNGEIDIAFNGKYVLEAISALKSDGILAELTEPSRPAVFRAADDGDQHFCVVMPMALG